jgi:hypothetical protein
MVPSLRRHHCISCAEGWRDSTDASALCPLSSGSVNKEVKYISPREEREKTEGAEDVAKQSKLERAIQNVESEIDVLTKVRDRLLAEKMLQTLTKPSKKTPKKRRDRYGLGGDVHPVDAAILGGDPSL